MSATLVRGWIEAAESVTALTGAGVSTDSGIPDYRGPQGVWTADPDAAKYTDIEHYLADPDIRRRAWLRRRDHPAWTARPNPAHRALVRLEKLGVLSALVTQNIDGLHVKAGSDPSTVVELHGNLNGVECVSCRAKTAMTEALDRVAAGESDPPCRSCGGILKSDVVFFGEQLDPQRLETAARAAAQCEVFLAIGTSLTVHPAAGLVDLALRSGARLAVFNAEPTPYDRDADTVIREPVGQALPAATPRN